MFKIMQAKSMFSSSSRYSCFDSNNVYAEMSLKVVEDFKEKLEVGDSSSCLKNFDGIMKQENKEKIGDQEVFDDEVNNGEEEEFSFVCTNVIGSPISAEVAFQNGRIRPMFPIFNQDLFDDEDDGDFSKGKESSSLRPPLKNFFNEEQDPHRHRFSSVSASDQSEFFPYPPFSVWPGKKAMDASPKLCKRSNSTGFSKLRRFRDLVLPSNNYGRDAFVILNTNSTSSEPAKKITKAEKMEEKRNLRQQSTTKTKTKANKGKTTPSAPEKHYIRNRAKREESKRKTHPPYRVGFFTDVNAWTRNILLILAFPY